MSRDIKPFGLRMPSKLKDALQKSAEENKRSLNAELVARLTESLNTNDLSDIKLDVKDIKQLLLKMVNEQ